ncbi:MAG TPA: hypothetical protein VF139_11305 [Candidatus Polarisedimenticolaceae bacterium]
MAVEAKVGDGMKKWTMALALIFGVVCFAGTAVAADVPVSQAAPGVEAPDTVEVPVVVEIEGLESDAACEEADASMATPAIGQDLADSATQVAACKPCKGRTWCKCTYNGSPRSSCDPCCYTNNIGVTVCLD